MCATSLARLISLSLLSSAAMAPPAPATVAQQDSGTVPEEFVRAMVGDADLLIGRMPDEFPSAMALPEGARVIGSVVSERDSTAYVSVTGGPDAIVAHVREAMAAAGWRTRPEPERPGGGFQRPEPESASATFCGPADEVLSLSAYPRADDTLAHVRFYAQYPAQVPCDRPTGAQRLAARDQLQERMPTLRLPRDGMDRNMGGGGSMDSRWSVARLLTDREPAQIAADVAEQVEAEGWVAGLVAGGQQNAVRMWTRTFEDGLRFNGMLLITELADGTYEAMFRIVKLPEG